MPKVQVAAKTITVEVSLKAGKLHIDAAHEIVHMGLQDKIRWQSKSGELGFWIVFENQTPFERHALDASHAQDLRRPLLHGAFKYHIVLESDHRVRIDPVVVVVPPPEDPYAKNGGG